MQYERLFLRIGSDDEELMIIMYIVNYVKQDSRLYITYKLKYCSNIAVCPYRSTFATSSPIRLPCLA